MDNTTTNQSHNTMEERDAEQTAPEGREALGQNPLVDKGKESDFGGLIDTLKGIVGVVASRRFGVMTGQVGVATRHFEMSLVPDTFTRATKLGLNAAWDIFWGSYAEWALGAAPVPRSEVFVSRRLNQAQFHRHASDTRPLLDAEGAELQIAVTRRRDLVTNTAKGSLLLEEDRAEQSSYMRTSGSTTQYGRMGGEERDFRALKRIFSRSAGDGPVFYDRSMEIVALVDHHRRIEAGGVRGDPWNGGEDVADRARRVIAGRRPGWTAWCDTGVCMLQRTVPPTNAQGQLPAGRVALEAGDIWHGDQALIADVGGAGTDAFCDGRDLPLRALRGGDNRETPVWVPGVPEGGKEVAFITEAQYLKLMTNDQIEEGTPLAGFKTHLRGCLSEEACHIISASGEQLASGLWIRAMIAFFLRQENQQRGTGTGCLTFDFTRILFVQMQNESDHKSVDKEVSVVGTAGGGATRVARCQWLDAELLWADLVDNDEWGLGGDWYSVMDWRAAMSTITSQCIFFGRDTDQHETATVRTQRCWRRFWEVGSPGRERRMDWCYSSFRDRYAVLNGYQNLPVGMDFIRQRPGSLSGLLGWCETKAAAGGAVVDAYAGAIGAGLTFNGDIWGHQRVLQSLVSIFGMCLLELSFSGAHSGGGFVWRLDHTAVGWAFGPTRSGDGISHVGGIVAERSWWSAHVRFPWGLMHPRLGVKNGDRVVTALAGTAVPRLPMAGVDDPISVLDSGMVTDSTRERLISDPLLAGAWLGSGLDLGWGLEGVRITSAGSEVAWDVGEAVVRIPIRGETGTTRRYLPFLPPRYHGRHEVNFKVVGWTGDAGETRRPMIVDYGLSGIRSVPDASWEQGEFRF